MPDTGCVTCQGTTTRTTVGMVCQTCGRDYAQINASTDIGRWSSDKPGELVTMPTEAEVTEFIRAEHAEAEAKVERLAKTLFVRWGLPEESPEKPLDEQPAVFRSAWLDTAREILEEIE